MEDALEMIDRKNSAVSIKKAALGLTNSSGSSTGNDVGYSSSKLKTASTSSSDSASTSGSFNDIGGAPPGYNIFDDSMHTTASFLDESAPHRELPVDVPDSFVGTIKQAPRYPQSHQPMPSISTFKPLPTKSEHNPKSIDLPSNTFGSNNPFLLHDEMSVVSPDSCLITNGINTNNKSMQPQPQTPSVAKDKVFFVNLFVFFDF